ncbi:MAG: methylated-DNA--[protein]-cysteine S-methyltransferase [Thermodesulfobacteriota bacterium]|nr:MAG: methylated-DNA--[protein]-cysteine S-methyltransferase [Thermodesulfobacteriota bacterium]
MIKNKIFYLQILNRTLEVRGEWENGFLIRIKLDFANETESWAFSPLAQKLRKILEGKLNRSSIPFKAKGTAFQKMVWDATARIPFGGLRSYSEIASEVGCSSPRAVGQALKSNPLPIIIPCHRVIGKGGSLVGFSCGLEIKALLLQLEKNE